MGDEANDAVEELSAPQAGSGEQPAIGDLRRKMQLKGTVKRLELYGAFIDIGIGSNAILHISKLPEKVNRISDALKVRDEVTVWVDQIDVERDQVTVTMVEPLAVEWSDLKDGQVYWGTVSRLEKFGAFVDIGAEREGLIHVSELSSEFIKHPSDAVKIGDKVQVQVLGFNRKKRRIDLSRKALLETEEAGSEGVEVVEDEDELEDLPTAMEMAWHKATGRSRSGSSAAGKAPGRKRRRRKRVREEQDDILKRTLKLREDQPAE